MDFYFFVKDYDFIALKKHAQYLAQSVGAGGLYLTFGTPSASIKRLFAANAKKPDLELVPDDIGQQEMEVGNGLWVSAKSNQGWCYVATRQTVLNKPYWSLNAEFQSTTNQYETITDIFQGLISQTCPDLAFGYDSSGAPFDIRYFSNDLGPWAGLRDIYWLNYYGIEFASLIGFNRIQAMPHMNYITEKNEGILFVVDKSHLQNRQLIIDAIGKQYFIEKSIRKEAHQSSGLIGLIKTIYQLKKDDKETIKIARSRPDIQ